MLYPQRIYFVSFVVGILVFDFMLELAVKIRLCWFGS